MKLKHLVLSSLLFVPLSCASLQDAKPSILPLRSTEHHDVFVGDVIQVEKRTLEYQGESKVVDGQIITPNGDTFTGHSFTIEEPGLYRIVYKAYFGFHEEIQEIEKAQNIKCIVTKDKKITYCNKDIEVLTR